MIGKGIAQPGMKIFDPFSVERFFFDSQQIGPFHGPPFREFGPF